MGGAGPEGLPPPPPGPRRWRVRRTDGAAAAGRLAWCLAHSSRGLEDVRRALNILRDLKEAELMAAKKHEVLYIMGVAHFRLGRYVQARYRAKAALELVPDMRQAVALKERAEDEMATEGLIGLGIATGVAVLGFGLAAAFSSKPGPKK